MKRYFSVDDEGMAEFHDTAEEAKQRAAEALEWATDGDIDEDAVNCICWGEVKGAPVETYRVTREEAFAKDPESEEGILMQRGGWDFIVKYQLQDVES